MSETELPIRPSHVLQDPSAQVVAQVYAASFLDAAGELGVANPLEEFASFQQDVLEQHPEFNRLLTSEVTSRDAKLALLERAVVPFTSELFGNFLRVLAQHERLELLPLILGKAEEEQERRTGRRRVIVRSAVGLDAAQQEAIAARLRKILSQEPILMPEVDESLLGGLVVQIGDTVYDSSLRTRLRALTHRLQERYLHEIQSGRDRFSHS
jgi:F-type H+-transporting ATPase subunit delta